MIRRDLMMPLNFKDQKSGTDYFTAAKQLIDAARASGDPLSIAPIPFWENMFPDAAGDPLEFGGNYTATQNMAEWFMENEPDWMTALWVADEFCFPACATGGAFTFFNQQYDSLGGDELDGAIAIQRPAVDAAEALEPRLSVRRELHAGPRDGSFGSAVERGRRSATRSTTAATAGSSSTRGISTSSRPTPTSTSVTRST